MNRVEIKQKQSELPWQQRKSAKTREIILDAAMNCLVSDGYARLTSVEVIKRAKVSRGAMHHHFTNRLALVSALIDHVLHKRLERFLSDYLGAIEGADSEKAIEVATELHWNSVTTPEFAAFLELLMVSRTDKELADIFVPATKAFESEWISEMEKAMPQLSRTPGLMLLGNDLAASLHLGMLVNRPYFSDEARRDALKRKLVEILKELYR